MECAISKDRKIGPRHPVFLLAEMAWAHDGSVANAKMLIEAVAKAGFDAINIHVTSLPDYMVQSYDHDIASPGAKCAYAELEKDNLSFQQCSDVLDHVRSTPLLLSVLCNDQRSLEFVRRCRPDAYKIHSSCYPDGAFIRNVTKEGKPIFIGNGGTTIDELQRVIGIIRGEGNNGVVLFHGYQAYPTSVEDMNLRRIGTLRRMFGLPIGFDDHSDATSGLSSVIPVLAIGCGADAIEKHITHSRALKGNDFEAALEPDELVNFVRCVRQAARALGDGFLRPMSSDELRYRELVKKRAVAAVDLPAGKMLEERDIIFKRSSRGIFTEEVYKMIGLRLTKPIRKDDPITRDVVGG